MEHWRSDTEMGKQKYWVEKPFTVTLCPWGDLAVNPVLRDYSQTTNCLSHCTA